jgi:hypothetical protein
VLRSPVTPNFVRSSPILVTLMMEALSSSETSVLTRGTRRDIPEDAILQSHLDRVFWDSTQEPFAMSRPWTAAHQCSTM